MPTKARIPIPVDTSPVNTKCFSFNVPEDSEWLAMFWGALYQLSAWNSYYRDIANSGKVVADTWKDIIDTARLGNCGDNCPGFYLNLNIVNCPNTLDLVSSRVVNDCGSCVGRERVYFSRSIIDIVAGVARVGYSCFDFTDDTPCGGHICQVRAFQTGIGYPFWVLQWRDCLDQDHEYLIDGTDEFVYNDFTAKWFCLSLNSNFCATVGIDGPVVCAQA